MDIDVGGKYTKAFLESVYVPGVQNSSANAPPAVPMQVSRLSR